MKGAPGTLGWEVKICLGEESSKAPSTLHALLSTGSETLRLLPSPSLETWKGPGVTISTKAPEAPLGCARNGTPLQHSCLENPVDGGAWWAAVHGVAKSRTRLSDFTFTFHFHALEKAMAPHSSTLAWKIPGKEEPGELPSMGSLRVGHD